MRHLNTFISTVLIVLITSCKQEKTIYPTAATADFLTTSTEYNIGEEVTFNDSSIPSEGNSIISWEWDFGNSSIPKSTNKETTVTFEKEAIYQITLTVTDNNGLRSSISKTISIIDPINNLRVIWSKPLAEAVQNTVSPALSSDEKTVYMYADRADANGDLKLAAYNTTDGSIKWEFNIDQAFSSTNTGGNPRQAFCSPTVSKDGTIYFAIRDLQSTASNRKSFLFALTPTGTIKWQYAFGYDVNFNYLSIAIGNDGNIYAGGLTNAPFNIIVLNASTGVEQRRIPLPVGIRSGISLSRSGDIYFASTGSNGIYSYSSSSSIQKFNHKPSGLSSTGGSFSIDTDGTIYTTAVAGSNGLITALTPDGSIKWTYQTSAPIDFGGVSIGSTGTIYAPGGRINSSTGVSDGLVALHSDGTLKWKFETNQAVTNCIPLVDNREYIHFITDEGTYYIIKEDGTLYSTLNLGLRSFSSPVMDAQGRVYIAVEKPLGTSSIICITSRAQKPADSAWPMKGQNSQRTHQQ